MKGYSPARVAHRPDTGTPITIKLNPGKVLVTGWVEFVKFMVVHQLRIVAAVFPHEIGKSLGIELTFVPDVIAEVFHLIQFGLH